MKERFLNRIWVIKIKIVLTKKAVNPTCGFTAFFVFVNASGLNISSANTCGGERAGGGSGGACQE